MDSFERKCLQIAKVGWNVNGKDNILWAQRPLRMSTDLLCNRMYWLRFLNWWTERFCCNLLKACNMDKRQCKLFCCNKDKYSGAIYKHIGGRKWNNKKMYVRWPKSVSEFINTRCQFASSRQFRKLSSHQSEVESNLYERHQIKIERLIYWRFRRAYF